MNTEHTPGPWDTKIVDYGDMKEVEAIVSPAAAYTPRDTFFVVLPGAIVGRSLDECDANARLIAAAPELLASLESLFEHCAMVHRHWGEGSNQKEADAAQAAARAAIAKAKGAPTP